jgi:hypothetical protein
MVNPNSKTAQDVRHMSLGMDGAWDAFRKFEWEVDAYKRAAGEKVPTHPDAYREIRFPMYAEMNAAATAWSLIEWVWFEVELDPEARSKFLVLAGATEGAGLPQVKHALRQGVPAINACHQIAHATKHAQLRDVTSGFSTKVTYGIWQKSGWLYWSTHAKLLWATAGQEQPIDEAFEEMRAWWLRVLTELRVPDRVKLVSGERDVR